jgi:hypothetical protein
MLMPPRSRRHDADAQVDGDAILRPPLFFFMPALPLIAFAVLLTFRHFFAFRHLHYFIIVTPFALYYTAGHYWFSSRLFIILHYYFHLMSLRIFSPDYHAASLIFLY